LEQLEHELREDAESCARQLAAQWPDPRVKLLVTTRALALRRQWPEVFSAGQYVPLEATGDAAENLFAFARRHENQWVVVATPRNFHRLTHRGNGQHAAPTAGQPPHADWRDTRVILPADSPPSWRCEISGRTLEATAEHDTLNLRAADLFDILPVALLSATAKTASKDT
jgi:(1->4)-alpha-D-glucan 1-alpha-D-glucosylmutase